MQEKKKNLYLNCLYSKLKNYKLLVHHLPIVINDLIERSIFVLFISFPNVNDK